MHECIIFIVVYQMIVSRIMSEMDPSIDDASIQGSSGWDKVGQVSYADFCRATALLKDIDTRLSVGW